MSYRRVQRKRIKGWKMPPNTVYVGRPTKWGNPFSISDYQLILRATPQGQRSLRRAQLQEQIKGQYKAWLMNNDELMANLPELTGKNLACWCRHNSPCHADVLLELANSEARNVEKTNNH